MMDGIILKNGKRYALVQPACMETRFERGAEREVLLLKMLAENVSLDAVAADFGNTENTVSLKLLSGGEEYAYADYCVFLGAGLKPMLVEAQMPTKPAQSKLCVSVELGQLTYIEKQLQRLGVQL